MVTRRNLLKRAVRDPLSVAGAAIVMVVVLAALLAPLIAPYPQDAGSTTRYEAVFAPPGNQYLLGTDYVGRDMFSRILMGARISLVIGIGTTAIAVLIGVCVGVSAGLGRRWLDELLMRLSDVILAFPTIALAILISVLWGRDLVFLMLAVAFTWWPKYARLTRALTLSMREQPFVEAARGLGSGAVRVGVKHVLPNILAPLIVQVTLDVGYMILIAASLGFVGAGAQPPLPEWGLMVSIGRRYMPVYWWLSVFPGLAILITVLGFNLLGDGLRDLLDPKQRSRGLG
jgi:peptide/nickel transport system permease protein